MLFIWFKQMEGIYLKSTTFPPAKVGKRTVSFFVGKRSKKGAPVLILVL